MKPTLVMSLLAAALGASLWLVTAPSVLAEEGRIVGHAVVAGSNSRGEVSTGVFIVPVSYRQPLTFAQTLERALRLEDPSGKFEFEELADGEYLIALENTLLQFSETYSDIVRVQVGPNVITVPAQRVKVEAGRQDRPIVFRVTPATAARRPPPITAPSTGQGDVELLPGGVAGSQSSGQESPSDGLKDWIPTLAFAGAGLVLLLGAGYAWRVHR